MDLRRPLGLVASLGLVVTMSSAMAPAHAVSPTVQGDQPVMTGSSFFTSFEPGQPQPGYTDAVETGPDGKPRADGVRGPTPTGIGGSEMDKVTKVTANGENTGGGEIATNAADGDKFTKWLVFEPTGWLVYETSAPVVIRKYALTSANDADGRDPQNWTVSGSNDGTTWTTLDTRTGESFENRFQTKEYSFTNETAYKFFKLDITLNHGEDIVQLADWYLSNGAPLPPPGPTAESRLDSGPTSAYNARARVGFTGVKSFRYAGHQEAEGRGYTWNKISDVDLKVSKDTRLSYKIFPEHVEGDLSYPSTYAALDLAFSDGTYLSDLNAKDHHGFTLSPRGQGDAKGLSTNQWNNVEADLGTVAAGKTIQRILIGYDKPSGPADFRGWVDDVRIAAAIDPDRAAQKTAAKHPSDLALTTRGTNATGGFSRGNNFPATAVPHGFNFWTPVTNAGSTSWLYDYAKGNNEANKPTMQALSISHEPSPWMGDRQTFQVMPSTATTPTADRKARAWSFSHDNEIARPYYYGVTFDNGNAAEIAPTDHAAMLRFSFPAGKPSLVFDNVSNSGGLTLDPETGVVTGFSDIKSGLSTGAGRLFVYGVVDQKVVASGKLSDGGGANVGGYFAFDPKATQVQLRIATSLIGTAQAKKNLELELPAGSKFGKVKDAAQDLWDAKLRTIEVEGATADQLTTMYSNLYRLFLYPNNGSENTGTNDKPVITYASPTSPKVGTDTPTTTGSKIVAGQTYVNNGFWDTYRTVWPAYSLFAQDEAASLVNGFVQQYKDGGWISRWSSPGYANLMVGTSSDVAFADAYLKGIKGIDVQAAYDAALKNASVVPPSQNVGRKGMDLSTFNGYTANSTGEGFSWSMDGYINDFGIANMSKKLYDTAKKSDPRKQEYLDNYKYFINRARNYVDAVRPGDQLLPGQGPGRRLGQLAQHVRPAGLGSRLHRDERVEHGVLGAAGRCGHRRAVRRPRRPGEEARRDVQHPRGRTAPRWVRRHDPRDARGPRRTDGSVRAQQPAVAPPDLHVRLRGSAVEDAGEGARGAVPVVPGLGDRAGVPGRRGQRRDVLVVPVQHARVLPVAGRLADVRDRVAAVHQGDGAAGRWQEAGGQRAGQQFAQHLRAERSREREDVDLDRAAPRSDRERRQDRVPDGRPAVEVGHRPERRAAVDHHPRRGPDDVAGLDVRRRCRGRCRWHWM